jgi:serine/threonine protein kinase
MTNLPPVGVDAFLDPELGLLEREVLSMNFGDWIPKRIVGKGGYGLAVEGYKSISIDGFTTHIPGAIKIMLPKSRDDYAKKLITKEIDNLSKMNSRFVTKLLDAGITTNSAGLSVPYFVMDYVEGPNLFKIVEVQRKRTLSGLGAGLFKTLASHTLRALQSAHKNGIHHLDIKPHNVLYSVEDDAFVLIDFGIAVVSNREVVNRYIGGTPGFIAPETFEEVTTKKADIYSLGMTFYHAITGVNPIWQELAKWELQNGKLNSANLRVVQKISLETNIDFSDLLPDQRELIEPMLSRDPKARPSLTKLIDLSNRLEVPTEIKLTKMQDELIEGENTWEKISEEVYHKIIKTGIETFRLEIDEKVHYHVWFKTKKESDKTVLVCSRIRDTSGFSELGWVRFEQGLMKKELDELTPHYLAKVVVEAMRFGYRLQPPFELT